MNTQELKNNLIQNYALYTPEDFQVWRLLFDRQMKVLNDLAAKEYLDGINIIQFCPDRIPNFVEVNHILSTTTGWSVEVVEGIIHKEEFLNMLANKKFPATAWLRKLNELDYLPEPDMFHDVFAHLPLLTNQRFCNFFQSIGLLGVKYKDYPQIVAKIERFYWFTVEFGLIRQDEALKIFGAGILSSNQETYFSVGPDPKQLPFDVGQIINTSFDNTKIQDTYFVIESFDQLYDSISQLQEIIEKEAT